MIKARILFFKA